MDHKNLDVWKKSIELVTEIHPIAQMLSGLKRHLKQKEIDN